MMLHYKKGSVKIFYISVNFNTFLSAKTIFFHKQYMLIYKIKRYKIPLLFRIFPL